MEPPVTPAPDLTPEEQASAPQPTPGPVMDVVAPKPSTPSPQPAAPPSMADKLAAAAADLPSKDAPPKPAAPKAPKTGVGAAITGTVIIIIVLAGLAVYAFLQQK